MAKKTSKSISNKSIEALTHEEAKRKNIPAAEYQSVLQRAEQEPIRVAYERGTAGLDEEKKSRNRELIQFLCIAKGSAAEVQAQLYVALDAGYLKQEQFQPPTTSPATPAA